MEAAAAEEEEEEAELEALVAEGLRGDALDEALAQLARARGLRGRLAGARNALRELVRLRQGRVDLLEGQRKTGKEYRRAALALAEAQHRLGNTIRLEIGVRGRRAFSTRTQLSRAKRDNVLPLERHVLYNSRRLQRNLRGLLAAHVAEAEANLVAARELRRELLAEALAKHGVRSATAPSTRKDVQDLRAQLAQTLGVLAALQQEYGLDEALAPHLESLELQAANPLRSGASKWTFDAERERWSIKGRQTPHLPRWTTPRRREPPSSPPSGPRGAISRGLRSAFSSGSSSASSSLSSGFSPRLAAGAPVVVLEDVPEAEEVELEKERSAAASGPVALRLVRERAARRGAVLPADAVLPQEIVLDPRFGDSVRIGAGRRNDVVAKARPFATNSVHAVAHFELGAGLWVLRDKSRNRQGGVLVNGVRVRKCHLQAGDVIVLGSAAGQRLGETHSEVVRGQLDSPLTYRCEPADEAAVVGPAALFPRQAATSGGLDPPFAYFHALLVAERVRQLRTANVSESESRAMYRLACAQQVPFHLWPSWITSRLRGDALQDFLRFHHRRELMYIGGSAA